MHGSHGMGFPCSRTGGMITLTHMTQLHLTKLDIFLIVLRFKPFCFVYHRLALSMVDVDDMDAFMVSRIPDEVEVEYVDMDIPWKVSQNSLSLEPRASTLFLLSTKYGRFQWLRVHLNSTYTFIHTNEGDLYYIIAFIHALPFIMEPK